VLFEDHHQRRLIERSLSHLSQLITLEIYQEKRGESIPYGQIWEQLIRSSLPLLKHFKFYFRYRLYPHNQIEEIIASFSTPFYLHEKSWFVRCDLYEYQHEYGTDAILYSLPFAFDRFSIHTDSFDQSVSTSLNSHNKNSNSNIYTNVKTLVFEQHCPNLHENFKRNNINNLIIRSVFNSLDWIDVFSKLRHLEIESSVMLSEHFSYLLANTPHLYSLTTRKSVLKLLTKNWTHIVICNQLSDKIRSLQLYSRDTQSQFMSRDEFHRIVAIFSRKCEHLSICIQSEKRTIGFILRNMSQLHSLHVYINGSDHRPISMGWLEHQQKIVNRSNCSIINDRQNCYFWLGRNS
jgi:hypothetical protein